MATITEDYVSLETANLLKEKGFGIKTTTVYTITDCFFKNDNMRGGIVVKKGQFFNMQFGGYKANGTAVPAPTFQMAMKWLREVHKWVISINPYWPEGDMRNALTWYYDVYSLIDNRSFRKESHSNCYEEACESALKYCLENLI